MKRNSKREKINAQERKEMQRKEEIGKGKK